MSRTFFLVIAGILCSLAFAFFANELPVFLAAGVMMAIVVFAIRDPKPWMMKLTRWSKANPRKTQVFIAVTQLLLLAVGIFVGYDLQKLGMRISDFAAWGFGVLMLAGFIAVPFFPKKNIVVLPIRVFRQRIAFAVILISSYAMAVIFGNRVEEKHPNTIVADVLQTVDESIFGQGAMNDDTGIFAMSTVSFPTSQAMSSVLDLFGKEVVPGTASPSKKEAKILRKEMKKSAKMEKKMKWVMKKMDKLRKALAAASTGGSIALIILLIIVACAGVCMIVLSEGSVALIALGIVVLGLAIWGFISMGNKNKKPKPLENPSQ